MHRGIEELLTREISDTEQDRIDMFDSLMSSVIMCGGDSTHIEEKVLSGMTVLELIDILGQNKVRFYLAGE